MGRPRKVAEDWTSLTEEQERRYRYLLGSSELFDRFVEAKRTGRSALEVLLSVSQNSAAASPVKERVEKKKPAGSSKKQHRHAQSEGEEGEDAANVFAAEGDALEDTGLPRQGPTFTESPPFVEGGRLRAYQVQGLNWLVSLYENGLNGILADEMGLGKTLQTLSLLAYLKACRGVPGPHILIVPKSTLQNWRNEAARWVPSLRAFVFHGSKEERPALVREYFSAPSGGGEWAFDVCITSYEMCLSERTVLRRVPWQYVVIDEAHRIKNEASRLSLVVRELRAQRRLLITGTPLQNNLHELWALLNFLLPDVFGSADEFDAMFVSGAAPEDAPGSGSEDGGDSEGKDSDDGKTTVPSKDAEELDKIAALDAQQKEEMVVQLRRLLEPFLLRRLKADVEHSLLPKKELNIYVPLTDMQRAWYRRVLEKDLSALNAMLLASRAAPGTAAALAASAGVAGREGVMRLQNIAMQLRKVCNHPYLFDGAEPGPPFTTDEHIVANSGKMRILDGLLARWKAAGSRVLIFSQMARMLDILEDYCGLRGYSCCRIDGSTPHDERVAAIDAYNAPGSDKFVFLLTTRAGGLGINLATADTVVLYDSDWNPQADLQAQDRAHRIGQTRQVCVFRMVSEGTIEEKIIERALQKLRLDQLVIQAGKLTNVNKPLSKDEMLAMIRHGAGEIIRSTFGPAADAPTAEGGADSAHLPNADIEEILRVGEERTRAMLEKYRDVGYDALQKFAVATSAPVPDASDPHGGDPVLIEIPPEEADPALGAYAPGLARGARRTRAGTFGVDAYFREALRVGPARPAQMRAPVPRGLPALHDFQFFPARLHDLVEAEVRAYQRAQGWRVPEGFYSGAAGETDEERVQRAEEQARIDAAVPLTAREEEERDSLLAHTGFGSWSRREYQAFLRAVERHGRDAHARIAEDINAAQGCPGTKSAADVRRYAQHFWAHVEELADYERIEAVVERAQERLRRAAEVQLLLEAKIARHARARTPVAIPYLGSARGRLFSEDEDVFILTALAEIGAASGGANEDAVYEALAARVAAEPAFRFDWFMRTRTPADLQRRAAKLVALVEREHGKTAALPADVEATPVKGRGPKRARA